MNIDIASLKSPETHPLKSFFKYYSLAQLARQLGVSRGHFSNVLNGHVSASAALEVKMKELVAAIIAAEKADV